MHRLQRRRYHDPFIEIPLHALSRPRPHQAPIILRERQHVLQGGLQCNAAARRAYQAIVAVNDDIPAARYIGYHAGHAADSRMRAAAAQRGYSLDSIARRIVAADFERFD